MKSITVRLSDDQLTQVEEIQKLSNINTGSKVLVDTLVHHLMYRDQIKELRDQVANLQCDVQERDVVIKHLRYLDVV